MQLVVVEGVDRASVALAVGAQTYARGVEYAQQRAVLHMEWDGEAGVLEAVVRGSGGAGYETAVYFQPQAGGNWCSGSASAHVRSASTVSTSSRLRSPQLARRELARRELAR